MKDFHAPQMTGSFCQGRNCAAASGAMAAFFGRRGAVEMTADSFRNASGVSCVPGRDTPSGGLTISAVEGVLARAGVTIDYGRAANSYYRRWVPSEGKSRLGTYYGGIILGDYGQVPAPWRAKGSTFTGGHSVWVHDFREDRKDSHYDIVQATVCWHDPLRPRPIRVPWGVVLNYWQDSGDLKGFAGWVKIPPIPGGVYANPMTDRTRVRYSTLAVHDERTTGVDSTVRVIRGQGKLVELAMYANGESYQRSREWGALSLLGDEWVHLKRLNHVRGTT